MIPITVKFNAPVIVDTTGGTPALRMAVNGGTAFVSAAYTSGDGTDTLTFQFTAAAGESTPLLDDSDGQALTLNGGKILVAGANTPAVLRLTPPRPRPKGSGSWVDTDISRSAIAVSV